MYTSLLKRLENFTTCEEYYKNYKYEILSKTCNNGSVEQNSIDTQPAETLQPVSSANGVDTNINDQAFAGTTPNKGSGLKRILLILVVAALLIPLSFLIIILIRIIPTHSTISKDTGPTENLESQSKNITLHADLSQFQGTYSPSSKNLEIDRENNQIYLINQESNRILLATIPNLYSEHYHPAVLVNGNLFVILRHGDTANSDNWSDELWRVDSQGGEQRMWQSQGIDFRVSLDTNLITLTHNNTGKLLFVDGSGEQVFEFSAEDLLIDPQEPVSINLDSWSDSGTFWGTVSFTLYPYNFFEIDPTNWQLTKYSLPSQSFNHKLNPNIGKIAYHTFPHFFDADGYEEYVSTNPSVSLYIFDLNSGAQELVLQTQAEPFDYNWIDDTTLSYSTETLGENTYNLGE